MFIRVVVKIRDTLNSRCLFYIRDPKRDHPPIQVKALNASDSLGSVRGIEAPCGHKKPRPPGGSKK